MVEAAVAARGEARERHTEHKTEMQMVEPKAGVGRNLSPQAQLPLEGLRVEGTLDTAAAEAAELDDDDDVLAAAVAADIASATAFAVAVDDAAGSADVDAAAGGGVDVVVVAEVVPSPELEGSHPAEEEHHPNIPDKKESQQGHPEEHADPFDASHLGVQEHHLVHLEAG